MNTYISYWKSYKNGNYKVTINTRTGTKIRETEDDEFIPSFAENVDVLTSQCCDNGCAFCYAGCTPNGKHGELINWKFLDTLHPYTEMALNLNFPMPPQFEDLLRKLKEKNIITNVTINQNHFTKHCGLIQDWIDEKLIYGVGVSLTKATDEFIELIHEFPTAVVHTINGVTDPNDYMRLANNGLKILILGYKNIGRGTNYLDREEECVRTKQTWLYNSLDWITKHNAVVSFDNLALDQLNVRRLLSDKEWEEFYMGDDGTMTFFIDLVDGTFGKNSLATDRYPIMDSIDDMFNFIKNIG